MITTLEGQFHVGSVVGHIRLIMHGQELEEGHLRNQLLVFKKVLYQQGKTHEFIHLRKQAEMKDKHSNGSEASHGKANVPKTARTN
jgi:hypothetical protein